MIRFLRKRQLDVKSSVAALSHTLAWRKSFLPTLQWARMGALLSTPFVRVRPHHTRDGHNIVYVQANSGGGLSTDEKASTDRYISTGVLTHTSRLGSWRY